MLEVGVLLTNSGLWALHLTGVALGRALPERHEKYLCWHKCDLMGIPRALCRRTALTCAPPVRWRAQSGLIQRGLMKSETKADWDVVSGGC